MRSRVEELIGFGRRALGRFVEVEGAQQATLMAAQAFTSLVPFLVVVAAFGPGEGDIGDKLVERFDLHGQSEDNVRALFASGAETRSAVPWVAVGILLVSAMSFARVTQKMFEQAYKLPPSGIAGAWRGIVWLAGFTVLASIAGPLREELSDAGGVALAVAASSVSGFVLWLWTPSILLAHMDWRSAAPGALVSGVLTGIATVGSAIYIPIAMEWSSDRYGLIGVAFTLQSWLLAMGFVVVVGAVVGAIIVSERLARRASQ